MGTSAIVINGVQRELARMAEMVLKNVDESFQAVLEGSPARLEQVEETEEYIDYLNQQISRYISHIIVFETNPQDSEQISAFFKISTNLERIGHRYLHLLAPHRLGIQLDPGQPLSPNRQYAHSV